MKKSVKRVLALLLALLMTLGLSTAASAAAPPKKPPQLSSSAAALDQAAPNWTLSITTQPTNTSFEMHMEEPNLSGMVVSVSGGIFTAPTSIAYDTVAGDTAQAQDKILWEFWVGYPDIGWVVGNNTAVLYVWAYQCTDFHVVTTDSGKDYGYFDQELVFEGQTAITVVATPFDLGGAARTLTPDIPSTVTLDDGYYVDVFKFTAPSDGFYSFTSDGGQYGGTFYSQDGDVLMRDTIDPWAELYDADGYFLAWDDDRGGNWNFAIFRQLKQGEVVFLVVGGYAQPQANVTITATRVAATQPVLQLKSNDITVNFHELISLETLLEGTGLEPEDVWIDYDYEYIDYSWWDGGLYGVKHGVSSVTITAPDGSAAQVKITIKYSAAQWLSVILLGGWAWMPFTSVGPFNLLNEIKLLLDYGILNGLLDLFFDWRYGLFYRLLG